MQFELATAEKIIFGPVTLNSIGENARSLGKRVLIISGAPPDISDRLRHLLAVEHLSTSSIIVDREPTVEGVGDAIKSARHASADLVIGIGGGSAIDTAKAVAALLTNPGEITDYLEVVGSNKPLKIPSVPVIAIPTTAGTGAEVTKNAVIGSPAHQVKVSLRGQYLLPRIALVDPELTLGLPPDITGLTGLDALTQLIEPYVSNKSNPFTDALCVDGIKRVASSLLTAYNDGNDLQARENMSLASMFSGLALANAKLGAVHGFAGAIGGVIPAPHGAICACLLPLVMEANVKALMDRFPDHPALARYATIGKLLTGHPAATSRTAIRWVRDISLQLKIPPLSNFGIATEQFPLIIEKAMNSSSMKGNPVTLSELELRNILQRSLSS